MINWKWKEIQRIVLKFLENLLTSKGEERLIGICILIENVKINLIFVNKCKYILLLLCYCFCIRERKHLIETRDKLNQSGKNHWTDKGALSSRGVQQILQGAVQSSSSNNKLHICNLYFIIIIIVNIILQFLCKLINYK